MRILLDECVPRRFGRELIVHDVSTVVEMGWAGTKNGALLSLMVANQFEVLITVDQNLRHQQNLALSGVALVILVAETNRLLDLVPIVPHLLVALESIKPGQVIEVSAVAE